MLLAIITLLGNLLIVNCKMQQFSLDVNDILSENLMPASLMMIEGNAENLKNVTEHSLENDFLCATKELIDDGTLNNAFSTISFHRKMINEFLCSKFVASKILNQITPHHIESRLGKPPKQNIKSGKKNTIFLKKF